jgi:hypothetical protein
MTQQLRGNVGLQGRADDSWSEIEGKAEFIIKDVFPKQVFTIFDHITRFKDRWERSTPKACGHRGRNNLRNHAVDRRHLMEYKLLGPTDKISRTIFQPQWWNKNSHTLLKHHGKWRDADVKSDLTASSSQKIWNRYYCGWILTQSWMARV